MEGKKTWGGTRKNAGAKKKDPLDKRKTLNLYIKGRDIIRFGGESELKKLIYKFLGI